MNSLKFFTTLLLFALPTLFFSQSVPQGISYQAVARDATGQVYENTNVTVTVGILQNNILVWEEIHDVTTNQFGLISLTIGQGVDTQNGTLSNFEDIPWSTGSYTGQFGIEVDGGDYIDLGTSQFLTVPFAFYAQTVENTDDADADPSNELITNATLDNDILTITENGIDHQVDFTSLSQDDDWQTNGNIVYNDNSQVAVGTNTPTSTFHVAGSVSHQVTSIDENNAGLTLNDSHHVIVADVENGSFQINLPDATACQGREYIIKAYSTAGGNSLTVTTQAGQTIDIFSNSINLNGNSMKYVTLISDGANWWITGNN